ncbi:MAG: hypothetical protein C4K49_04115 [Candidatus Thorarchaeota archaeon]|nr:MAG: hypothetical protein C4K49_04115 [Candidatus Thorarchaeota archaeon]
MPEQLASVIRLLSVPLTREKQSRLLSELQTYASAANYIIKTIGERQIAPNMRALEALREDFEMRLFRLTTSEPDATAEVVPEDARRKFASRFRQDLAGKYIGQGIGTQGQTNSAFAEWYVRRYFDDVVRGALGEITRHRKLARTVRSLRNKTPHFKSVRMILSPPIAVIGDSGCTILGTMGEEIPIPFDKRSRSQESTLLHSIAGGVQQYKRVRLTWRKEGYVEVDVRLV